MVGLTGQSRWGSGKGEGARRGGGGVGAFGAGWGNVQQDKYVVR